MILWSAVALVLLVVCVLVVATGGATANAQDATCPATSAATATMSDGQLELSCEP